jgi:hypothetical protein
MKKLWASLLLLVSASAVADGIYLNNLKTYATGTNISAGHNGLDISGTISATVSNPSVGPVASPVPLQASYTGFKDGSGNLQPGNLNASGALKVDGSAVTQPVSAASLPLPTGAATAAKQPALGTAGTPATDVISIQGITSMTALKVDGSGVTQPVSAGSLPLPTGASTAAKQPALGTAGTPSADVISIQGVSSMTALKVDGSGVTQPVSASSLPLPTGAATVAKQPALGTAGTPAADVITVQGAASMTALKVDNSGVTQPVSPVAGATDTQTTGTVSTVITLTAPSNAQGFILQNLQTSTANVRFAMGATATTTLGMQLAPGQDSGFFPTSASVSLCSESGTQSYNVQWVAK